MNRQIEILAPAGSYDGMRAAMNAGCDAVYIGGSSFGARAYANNLDTDTLLQAIDEAHLRGKKLYLTVNTLLKEKELEEELYRFLEKFYLQGLDAVIVQDVGVMNFIHNHFPDLPIHASTQMTLTMAQGANLLRDYGVTRLVTSRELSLKEIRRIRENTDMEIETFVHGALCYCYSGQCLMSSVIGGRSGNRGRCAQPCRMPYQFFSENKRISSNQETFLLSPKDINTVALIPEFLEAGIDSFKIEGRMKRPEYAAAVSSVYRKYVDLFFKLGKEDYLLYIKGQDFAKDMTQLQDVFNRGGFSEGYGKTYNGKMMMSLSRPNHSGVYVGEVASVKGSQVQIALTENVNAQDILEIRDPNQQENYEFTVKASLGQGKLLTTNVGRRPVSKGKASLKQELNKQNPRIQEAKIWESKARESGIRDTKSYWSEEPVIHTGDKVYRTKNNVLLEQLASDYMNKDARQGINGSLQAKLGEKLSLTVTYRNHTVTASCGIVQEAVKQPMTKEKLTAPVIKTGDTLYSFEALDVDYDENIFVPVAWLNEIRRDAIRLLEDAVTAGYRRERSDIRDAGKEKKQETNIKQKQEINQDAEVKQKQEINQEAEIEQKPEINQDIEIDNKVKADTLTSPGVCVSVKTKNQFETALSYEEVSSIYGDYDTLDRNELLDMAETTKGAGKSFYLMLPQICRLSVYDKLYKEIVPLMESDGITGFIIKNFEELALLQSLLKDGMCKKELVLNHNMYVYNNESKRFWRDLDITRFTAPVELNQQELKSLGISDCDFIVYGYLPLMVSAQCLYESTEGCRKRKTGEQNSNGYLLDRLGKKFFVQTNCKECYNTIYNGQCLSLLKQSSEVRRLNPMNIRLDFTLETGEEMRQVLTAFLDTYLYGKEASLNRDNYTTVHFKRGVE